MKSRLQSSLSCFHLALRRRVGVFGLALTIWGGLALTSTHRAGAAVFDEGHGWTGISLGAIRPAERSSQWGPGTQVGLHLALSDFWGLQIGMDASYHLSKTIDDEALPSQTVSDAFFGLRYNFDVFQYVPYLGLAAVTYFSLPPLPEEQNPVPLGFKLTLGLDWRYSRAWSLGALIDLHTPISSPQSVSFYSVFSIHIGYHFRL